MFIDLNRTASSATVSEAFNSPKPSSQSWNVQFSFEIPRSPITEKGASKIEFLFKVSGYWYHPDTGQHTVYCRYEIRRTLRAAKDRFMEKFMRFKTRKWRRQSVFFRSCHRWVGGATDVVMSETGSINVIIFAFSQRWGFHFFIWPTARVDIVALLRRLHRSR